MPCKNIRILLVLSFAQVTSGLLVNPPLLAIHYTSYSFFSTRYVWTFKYRVKNPDSIGSRCYLLDSTDPFPTIFIISLGFIITFVMYSEMHNHLSSITCKTVGTFLTIWI